MSRILLIDDDEDFRGYVQQLLTRAGYDVLQATDGREGLKVFAKESVDLVITDIIMPEMEGLELIITMLKEHPGTKVIAMSGGARIRAGTCLDLAAKLGAQHTLEKPIESSALLLAVQETLAN